MCFPHSKDSVESGEAGKGESRPAWSFKKRDVTHCWLSVTTMRICVATCLVFTIVSLTVSFKLLTENVEVKVISDVLLSPLSDTSYQEKNLGLVGRILQSQKQLGKKIDALSAWANNTGCIEGNGVIIRTKCIRLAKLGMDYDNAMKYCKSLGGFVAFIENEEEYIKVLEHLWFIGFNRASELWVGMRKNTTNGIWRYSNGEVASFTKWAPNNVFEEGHNCAQIRPDIIESAGIYDKLCSEIRLSMCQFRQS